MQIDIKTDYVLSRVNKKSARATSSMLIRSDESTVAHFQAPKNSHEKVNFQIERSAFIRRHRENLRPVADIKYERNGRKFMCDRESAAARFEPGCLITARTRRRSEKPRRASEWRWRDAPQSAPSPPRAAGCDG
jgi:hypothetical protein